MTPFYKCFQNCMCSFREKWVINLIIWHSTLPYFNPLLITVPLKSKVPFRRNSEIKWPTANSSVAWLLFCWMRNIVRIFHFSVIPVKTHAKEISRTPRKRPWRFSKKITFFLRFHNGSYYMSCRKFCMHFYVLSVWLQIKNLGC